MSVVLAHNYAKLSHRFNNWNPADIWDALRIIIVDHYDVKPEAVTRQTRFVEDLGMG